MPGDCAPGARQMYEEAMSIRASNPGRARALLKVASRRGSLDATYEYGLMLARQGDQYHALQALCSAARGGHLDALIQYGLHLERGEGCDRNRPKAYLIFRRAARVGDARGCYHSGRMLRQSNHDARDAFRLLKAAADQNVPGALCELGLCYRDGFGCPRDLKEAAKIFKLLAEQRDPAGMVEYAIALRSGAGVEKDESAAHELSRRVLASDDAHAKLSWAQYLEGVGDAVNAEQIYGELAANGEEVAEYRLAVLLQKQSKVDEAASFFERANQHGHPTAFFSLALLEVSRPETLHIGLQHLKEAADAGNAVAQFNYAFFLEENHMAPADVASYYKLASDAGLPHAMCNYAMLLRGTDPQQALRLFKDAADKGHAISAYEYARAIQKADPDAAVQEMYLQIAAKANHPKAQYQLSVLYSDSNPQESLFLLQKAAQGGYSKARRRYDSITQNPGAKLKQIVTEEVDPGDAESIFRASSQIQEPGAARAYIEQFLKDEPLFQLRYGQVLMRSDPPHGISVIRLLAESGFIEAKFVYATILQEGKLTKQNMLLARKYYQEAAKANHPMALCRFGRLMKVEDHALAIQLFQKAADLGFPDGQYHYGRMLEGNGLDSEAIEYYSLACSSGLAKAQFRFGRCHEVCPKERRDFAIAADFYELAAAQGHAKAQNNLGRLLELGIGRPQDKPRAAHYYELAANQGNSFGLYNLARVLELGIGIPCDLPRAASIYRELANNHGLAQFHYARMCHNGIGVAIDCEEAKRYYLRAIDSNIIEAKQNYAVLLVTKFHEWNQAARYFEMAIAGDGAQESAKYDFAQLLLQGMGVARDVDAAERLFRETARTFIPAMFCYAQVLEGKGDKGAVEYYTRAAESEDQEGKFIGPRRNAQFQLALLYKYGKFVDQNDELSKKYMTLAAENHHPEAEEQLAPAPKWGLMSLI